MNGLSMKDRPWLYGAIVAGAIGLSFSAASTHYVHLFVLGPNRLELLFWIAASSGLVLGALSMLWDDMLGTREFLAQRPVSARDLALAPLRACLLVLMAWMILVPIGTWLIAVFWSGMFRVVNWEGVGYIVATLMIAWPACAIGSVAAAMPLPWWLRVLVAAALALSVGLLIPNGTESDNRTSPLAFVLACVAFAAVLFAIAQHCNAQRHDPDRPWPARTRIVAGAVLLLSFGHSLSALGREALTNAVRSAQWSYPEIARLDNEIGLVARTDNWREWVQCDADHSVVGEPRPRTDFGEIDYRPNRMRDVLEIEAPRFHSHYRNTASLQNRSSVLVHRDGRAWVWDHKRHGVHPTGIGPDGDALWPGAELRYVDDVGEKPNRRVVVAADPDSGRLLRFDEAAGYFVEMKLPGGDRFEDVDYVSEKDASRASALPALAFMFEHDDSVSHIRGAAGTYALKDGEVVAFDAPKKSLLSTPVEYVEGKVIGKDPLSFAVEVPAHDGAPAFRHDYEPRTATERFYAGLAMASSVVRPPVAQAGCTVLCDDDTEPGVFVDRLVAGGKRLWLLLLTFGIAAGGAVLVHRRMKSIGASDRARTFWVVASALIGPIAAILAVLVETRRRHARPNLVAPVAPRIVSKSDYTEIRA